MVSFLMNILVTPTCSITIFVSPNNCITSRVYIVLLDGYNSKQYYIVLYIIMGIATTYSYILYTTMLTI